MGTAYRIAQIETLSALIEYMEEYKIEYLSREYLSIILEKRIKSSRKLGDYDKVQFVRD